MSHALGDEHWCDLPSIIDVYDEAMLATDSDTFFEPRPFEARGTIGVGGGGGGGGGGHARDLRNVGGGIATTSSSSLADSVDFHDGLAPASRASDSGFPPGDPFGLGFASFGGPAGALTMDALRDTTALLNGSERKRLKRLRSNEDVIPQQWAPEGGEGQQPSQAQQSDSPASGLVPRGSVSSTPDWLVQQQHSNALNEKKVGSSSSSSLNITNNNNNNNNNQGNNNSESETFIVPNVPVISTLPAVGGSGGGGRVMEPPSTLDVSPRSPSRSTGGNTTGSTSPNLLSCRGSGRVGPVDDSVETAAGKVSWEEEDAKEAVRIVQQIESLVSTLGSIVRPVQVELSLHHLPKAVRYRGKTDHARQFKAGGNAPLPSLRLEAVSMVGSRGTSRDALGDARLVCTVHMLSCDDPGTVMSRCATTLRLSSDTGFGCDIQLEVPYPSGGKSQRLRRAFLRVSGYLDVGSSRQYVLEFASPPFAVISKSAGGAAYETVQLVSGSPSMPTPALAGSAGSDAVVAGADGDSAIVPTAASPQSSSSSHSSTSPATSSEDTIFDEVQPPAPVTVLARVPRDVHESLLRVRRGLVGGLATTPLARTATHRADIAYHHRADASANALEFITGEILCSKAVVPDTDEVDDRSNKGDNSSDPPNASNASNASIATITTTSSSTSSGAGRGHEGDGHTTVLTRGSGRGVIADAQYLAVVSSADQAWHVSLPPGCSERDPVVAEKGHVLVRFVPGELPGRTGRVVGRWHEGTGRILGAFEDNLDDPDFIGYCLRRAAPPAGDPLGEEFPAYIVWVDTLMSRLHRDQVSARRTMAPKYNGARRTSRGMIHASTMGGGGGGSSRGSSRRGSKVYLGRRESFSSVGGGSSRGEYDDDDDDDDEDDEDDCERAGDVVMGAISQLTDALESLDLQQKQLQNHGAKSVASDNNSSSSHGADVAATATTAVTGGGGGGGVVPSAASPVSSSSSLPSGSSSPTAGDSNNNNNSDGNGNDGGDDGTHRHRAKFVGSDDPFLLEKRIGHQWATPSTVFHVENRARFDVRMAAPLYLYAGKMRDGSPSETIPAGMDDCFVCGVGGRLRLFKGVEGAIMYRVSTSDNRSDDVGVLVVVEVPPTTTVDPRYANRTFVQVFHPASMFGKDAGKAYWKLRKRAPFKLSGQPSRSYSRSARPGGKHHFVVTSTITKGRRAILQVNFEAVEG